jgi:hypothetical protein
MRSAGPRRCEHLRLRGHALLRCRRTAVERSYPAGFHAAPSVLPRSARRSPPASAAKTNALRDKASWGQFRDYLVEWDELSSSSSMKRDAPEAVHALIRPVAGSGHDPKPGAVWLRLSRNLRDFDREPRPMDIMHERWMLGLLLGVVACGSRVEAGGGVSSGGEGASEPACELGALSCDGELLRLCTNDGDAWATLEVCASAQLCDPDFGCHEPACVEGETRCYGYRFQACSADRSGWESVEACTSAAACDALLGCQ